MDDFVTVAKYFSFEAEPPRLLNSAPPRKTWGTLETDADRPLAEAEPPRLALEAAGIPAMATDENMGEILFGPT